MNEITYVNTCLNNGIYQLLPNTIARGEVYKIPFMGDIDTYGYEVGYLYLPKGSSIKLHYHIDNIERYLLICGTLSVNGNNVDHNICTLNKGHNIDEVLEDTIIQYCKIDKYHLSYLTDLSNSGFDTLVTQVRRLKK